jgi:hypothetical protein
MRQLIAILVIVLTFLPPAPHASAQAGCSFQLGFKALHDKIPDIVGDCIGDEYSNNIGELNQPTTRGLLALRKADNRVVFTDGTTTWIDLPFSVVSRPNTDPPFSWEIRTTNPPAAQTVSPSPPVLTPVPDPNAPAGATAASVQWQLELVEFHRDRGLPDNANKKLAETVRPRGVFIVVILTARNVGNVPSALPRFELVDRNGMIFGEDRYAGLYGSFKYGTPSVSTQLIQPSLTSMVTVGFDVPRDAEGLALTIAAQQ